MGNASKLPADNFEWEKNMEVFRRFYEKKLNDNILEIDVESAMICHFYLKE